MVSKRDTVIENLDKIKEWLSQGVTMKDIAAELGMSKHYRL